MVVSIGYKSMKIQYYCCVWLIKLVKIPGCITIQEYIMQITGDLIFNISPANYLF